jgi:hypothetical protein
MVELAIRPPFEVLIEVDSFALVLYSGHKCHVKARRIPLQFPQGIRKINLKPYKNGKNAEERKARRFQPGNTNHELDGASKPD